MERGKTASSPGAPSGELQRSVAEGDSACLWEQSWASWWGEIAGSSGTTSGKIEGETGRRETPICLLE